MKQVERRLGEIALRVEDLDGMETFYRDVVGLEPLKRFDTASFFKLATGFQGHTQILALFDRTANPDYAPIDGKKSTVDHIGLSVSLEDFYSEQERLTNLDLPITTSIHNWVQWRSFYFKDPENNSIEYVAFDSSIEKD